MQLTQLPGDYAVARSGPAAPVPEGVLSGTGFRSVSRTEDELSVVAPTQEITGMDIVDRGWTAFKVHGPFAFDVTGVVAGLSTTIADAGIGIFVVSTYDTDYILVKSEHARKAADAWRSSGHEVT